MIKTRSFFAILVLLISILMSGSSANSAELDLSKTVVTASEKTEIFSTNSIVSVYLSSFRPNSEYWMTFKFPKGVNPSIGAGEINNLNINGDTIELSILNGEALNSSSSPILSIVDSKKNTVLEVYSAPKDLPQYTFEGDEQEMKKLNFLLTPSVTNGSYAMAIQAGRVRYFERFSNPVYAFTDLSDPLSMRVGNGNAKYAFLEKTELSRPRYHPGNWRLLDSSFQEIGKISKFKVFGQMVYPEGHGITTSPLRTPVVMSYVPRRVDSSWLDKPYDSSMVLDCVFSQLSNGKAIKSFSVWDWANSHRAFSKPILDLGERMFDEKRLDKPFDFCHANSIQFDKSLNSYVVSLRNLDLVMVLDSSLKTSTYQLYSAGARQHFARVLSPSQITAIGNYTNEVNSKVQTWTKSKDIWKLTEINLPFKMSYCGNAQFLTDTRIWVGGGCDPFLTGASGILYSKASSTISEIGRLKLIGSSGSYRVDLYKP